VHEIDRNERQTYYYPQRGLIPGKVGAIWIASRLKLRTFLQGEEAASKIPGAFFSFSHPFNGALEND
jgi:hypothetical protein